MIKRNALRMKETVQKPLSDTQLDLKLHMEKGLDNIPFVNSFKISCEIKVYAPQGDIDLANIQAYEFNLFGNMAKSKELINYITNQPLTESKEEESDIQKAIVATQ